MASFFGLMSFNWTVALDCFGCLDVFVFMVLVFSFLLFPYLVVDIPKESEKSGGMAPRLRVFLRL